MEEQLLLQVFVQSSHEMRQGVLVHIHKILLQSVQRLPCL